MGLLDFIFGKDPEWEEVSKDTFSTEDTYIYSKGESKQLFKLYLGKLGFSKEDIRDEVELYTESMQDDEEDRKEDISDAKEELKNATTKLNKFNKTKKNDEGKELSGEELQEYIEDLESDIKACEEDLTDQQKGSLLAFVAIIFITPDSLFIRLSNIDTWGLVFYRGAIPFFFVFLGMLIVYKLNFFKSTAIFAGILISLLRFFLYLRCLF